MSTESPSFGQTAAMAPDAGRMAAQLRKWQERPLDLTRGNPLLGLNRSRVSKLRVSAPEPGVLFDRLVAGEADLRMPLVRRKPRAASPPTTTDDAIEDVYAVEPGDLTF